MKGVVLAGGSGTRLRPLTRVVNKHLLPVYDRPMVEYPVRMLAEAGVEEIVLVTGRQSVGRFRDLLGDGRRFGLGRLEYAAQDGAGGVADALLAAEPFASGGRVCVALGDNLFQRGIRDTAAAFNEQPSGARFLLHRVADPSRYGVAALDGDRLVRIVEKPASPPSGLAVTGLYFYDRDVFDICRSLTPSDRGEYEITDVNNRYIDRGDATWSVTDGWWIDVGTFEGLYEAAKLVVERRAADAAAVD